MSRNRILSIVCLLAFCAIVISPPIIRGYLYPNIGDDTAMHMRQFDAIGLHPDSRRPLYDDYRLVGYPLDVLYGAYYIIGYPLDIASHVLHVDNDTLFFWFNYLALWGVGISMFFVFRHLLGTVAGLLALVVPVFTSFAVLLLFYSGVIFNIINMGIVLPWICYFAIRLVMTGRKCYAVGVVCLSSLFAVFHSTGVYLPFICLAGLIVYILYKRWSGEHIPKWLWACAGALGGLGLGVYFMVAPVFERLLAHDTTPKLWGGTLLWESLLHYMSPLLLVVMLVSLGIVVSKYRHLEVREKVVLALFGILPVVMLPAIVFGWSPQPMRQGYDFAILLSVFAVVLLGVVFRVEKQMAVRVLLVAVCIGGAFVHIGGWAGGYNSALERVDIEAIEYVNTLDGDSYSCSDTVDHWIYDRYLNKGYLPKGGNILIVRSEPMKSKVVLKEDGDLTSDRMVLNMFSDGAVEIVVYR